MPENKDQDNKKKNIIEDRAFQLRLAEFQSASDLAYTTTNAILSLGISMLAVFITLVITYPEFNPVGALTIWGIVVFPLIGAILVISWYIKRCQMMRISKIRAEFCSENK